MSPPTPTYYIFHKCTEIKIISPAAHGSGLLMLTSCKHPSATAAPSLLNMPMQNDHKSSFSFRGKKIRKRQHSPLNNTNTRSGDTFIRPLLKNQASSRRLAFDDNSSASGCAQELAGSSENYMVQSQSHGHC